MEPNDLDDDVSIVLKKSQELKIPSRYIFVSESENSETISMFQFVSESLRNSEKTLEEIFREIPSADPEVFCYVYYKAATKRKEKTENIFESITQFFEDIELPDPFKDLEDFLSRMEEEEESQTSYLMNDRRQLESIEEIQQQLLAVEKLLPYSNFEPTKANFLANLSDLNDSKIIISKRDANDIFASVECDQILPYICVNIEERSFFKIYDQIDESLNELINKSFAEEDSMYFILWTAEEDKYRNQGTNKNDYSIFHIKLYDTHSELRFTLNLSQTKDMQQEIIERIHDKFKGILIQNIEQEKISGEVKIYNFNPDIFTLTYFIANDAIMRRFLYIDETDFPFSFKDKLIFHGRSKISALSSRGDVTFTLNREKLTEDLKVSDSLIKKGTTFTTIDISKAPNLTRAKQFIKILVTLFTFYNYFNEDGKLDYSKKPKKQKYKDIVYNMFNSVLDLSSLDEDNKDDETDIKESNNEKLRKMAPELFLSHSSRKIAKGLPTIMTEEELSSFMKKNKIKQEEGNILRFPKENPRWIFVCTDPSYPYIGVTVNKQDNNIEFPYIPRCFASHPGPTSATMAYLNGLEYKKEAGSSVLKTFKFLEYSKSGSVPEVLNTLLGEKVVRIGTFRNVNSLLHCVLDVVSKTGSKYSKSLNKQDIAMKERKKLLSLETAIFKQELYDYTNEQIQRKLFDEEFEKLDDKRFFLDSSLFYRGIEEQYDVNIFVIEKNGNEVNFEIPRNKMGHIRPYRKRPNILLLKHFGTERDNAKYPQYEIIGRKVEEDIEMKWDDSIYRYFMANCKELYFSLSSDTIETRLNPYNVFVPEKLFGSKKWEIEEQYVDNCGKASGFVFSHPDKGRVTIFTPPTQPLNIPQLNWNKLPILENKTDLFPTSPHSVSLKDGKITGKWYSSSNFEFFVPVKPIEDYSGQPVKESPIDEKKNLLCAKRIAERKARLYKIIVQHLFIFGEETVKDFVKKYFIVDSTEEFDVSNIPRKLPTYDENLSRKENFINAATEFSENCSFIRVKDQKVTILAQNEKMVLGIRSFLEIFEKETEGLSITPYLYIPKYYLLESDFPTYPHNLLFTEKRQFELWKMEKENLKKNSKIFTKITEDKIEFTVPFIYGSRETGYCIIQNVRGHSLERAVAVSRNWKLDKYNVGFNVEPDLKIPPLKVYGISNSYEMVLLDDSSKGSEDYVEILTYGNEQYAGVLRLL